eukprot:5296109-Prymnesium_polylepis.1
MAAWPAQVLNGHVNKGRAPSVRAWCDFTGAPWLLGRRSRPRRPGRPLARHVPSMVGDAERCVVVLPALKPQA